MVGQNWAHELHEKCSTFFKNMAYCAGNVDLVTIQATMMYVTDIAVYKPVGNVTAMIPHVNVHIGACDLHDLCYISVLPTWLTWSRNVAITIRDTTLCDHINTPITPGTPDIDSIHKHCFVLSGKKQKKTLITTKAIKVNLLISNVLVTEGVYRRESLPPGEEPELSNTLTHIMGARSDSFKVSVSPKKRSKRKHTGPCTNEGSDHDYLIVSNDGSDTEYKPSSKVQRRDTAARPARGSKVELLRILSAPLPPDGVFLADFTVANTVVTPTPKDTVCGQCTAIVVGPPAIPTPFAAMNLSKERLVSALSSQRSGRSTSRHSIPIMVYCLPEALTLDDLLASPQNLDPRTDLEGQSTTVTLGECHTADVVIGKSLDVCLKRTFDKFNSATGVFSYPDAAQQYTNLAQELNCIRWASALLSLVYSWIEDQDRHPFFNIPQLHFVHAGLAVSQSLDTKEEYYLVEECYIHASYPGLSYLVTSHLASHITSRPILGTSGLLF
ncbi:hypothetical protein PM082_006187 [Marasmius tenuissimus]|nr:hypothetical protein PM082_006187 [Marasmius tenuissimus]